MSKESFEQFVKRQEKKIDKAKKMVEEVKERWKDKIEEFEMVEKSVKELKKLWEESEEEIRKKKYLSEIFSFISSLPLPEISPSLLERISNKFLKEFDWEKFRRLHLDRRLYLENNLGFFLSAFLNKNIENYISSQKNKGIKEENIKPIEVHLNVKELPVLLHCLGYQNPKKLHLIIEGGCGEWTGHRMEGGEIVVKGGYTICTGGSMIDGKITVEGNCGELIGLNMQGGELNIKGEVKSFDESAFSPDNKGTIIWKGIKIWEKGNWTKQGMKMRVRGEIPMKQVC